MAGTHAGGVKAAATNKRVRGADYYMRLGAKGEVMAIQEDLRL